MTNQISKDLMTHVILTFNKTTHFITSIQNDKIQTLGDKERISLGNSFLRVSSISEILPIEDYYKTHPKERPQYNNVQDFEKETPISKEQLEKNRKALKELRGKLKIKTI